MLIYIASGRTGEGKGSTRGHATKRGRYSGQSNTNDVL